MARVAIFLRFIPVLMTGFFVSGSLAATDTATFQVRIQIQAGCNVASVNDLDFGTTSTLSTNVDASTTIGIQCTNTTPYDVGLDAGLGVGATIANRIMTGPGGAAVAYSLYQDAGRSNLWGDIGSPDAVA